MSGHSVLCLGAKVQFILGVSTCLFFLPKCCVSPSCPSTFLRQKLHELPEFGQFRSEPSEFRAGVQKWVHPRVCSQFLPSSFPSSCGYFYHPVITRPQKLQYEMHREREFSFMHKNPIQIHTQPIHPLIINTDKTR
jgi:hypothetical protein